MGFASLYPSYAAFHSLIVTLQDDGDGRGIASRKTPYLPAFAIIISITAARIRSTAAWR
jgi:hypothetical protein